MSEHSNASPAAQCFVGAVHLSGEEPVDSVFNEVFQFFSGSGYQVHGMLQTEYPQHDSCCPTMFLRNLQGESSIQISQALGKGSTGCRVDPGAIAEATVRLENELDDDIDLLILNRFGRCESEGGGLRPAIEKAVLKNIPVLIAVRPKYRAQWDDFVGEFSQDLACEVKEIAGWCKTALDQRPQCISDSEVFKILESQKNVKLALH